MNYLMGCFVGRIWNNQTGGPCLVKVKDGFVYDITSKETPTVRDLLELENVDEYLNNFQGEKIISIEDLLLSSLKKDKEIHLLAPFIMP